MVDRASGGGTVTIDLRRFDFIDLYGMLGILYACADIRDRYRAEVQLQVADEKACSFLPRAGFFDVLPSHVQVPNAFGANRVERMRARRGLNDDFLELTSIDSEPAIFGVLKKLFDVLHRGLRYAESDAKDLVVLLSELCHNVLDHGDGNAQGLAAMLLYKGKRGKFVQFVVGDRGPGIRSTLTRNPDYSYVQTDVQAILQSIELGASEHRQSFRGNGLYHLKRLTFKHKGSVYVRSGAGAVFLRSDGMSRRFPECPHLSGVQFLISFPSRAQNRRVSRRRA